MRVMVIFRQAQLWFLNVIDDEEPEIILKEVSATAVAAMDIDIVMSEGDLASGSTRSVLVRLNSQPLSTINVNVAMAIETIFTDYQPVSLSLTGSSIQTPGDERFLVFTSDNWQHYQTLELAVLDDLDPYSGTVRLMLSVDALSTPVFGEAEATAVIVVMDDDPASIVLAATLTERVTTTLSVSVDNGDIGRDERQIHRSLEGDAICRCQH